MNPKPHRRFAGVAGGGALLAAVAASACCIGPLALAALGLGGAGYFLAFEPYRPYFFVSAVLLLALSLVVQRRRPGRDSCVCPPVQSRSSLSLVFIGGAALLLAGSAATEFLAAPAPDSPAHARVSAGHSASFSIEGITCASCEVGIRLRLRNEPGVEEVRVEDHKAHVVFDPTVVSAGALADAIRGLGYRVTNIEERERNGELL